MHQDTRIASKGDKLYVGSPISEPQGDALPSRKASIAPGQRWKGVPGEVLICQDGNDIAAFDMKTGARLFKGSALRAEEKLAVLGYKNG